MTDEATPLQPEQLIKLIENALQDLKAVELVNIDVSEKSSFADNMIVCTGTSRRHVVSLADHLMLEAKQAGHPVRGEGLESGEWALVDLGDVIVHVMQQATRDLYELEKLWSMAPPAAQAGDE